MKCPFLILILFYCAQFNFAHSQDAWSDPATWGGTVPIAGENVVIPDGMHVLLDQNTADLGGLTIDGILEFDNQDLNLSADWILVRGTLQVGTETLPYINQCTITLNDTDSSANNMGMGTRGIMVMGGSLELHGDSPSTIWTRINDHLAAGSSAVTLENTTDWQSGDQIIMSPTDYYDAGNGASTTQTTIISSISGTSMTINDPSDAFRWGLMQYATNTGMSLNNSNLVTPPATMGSTPTQLDERAIVANLSRNIVIQAPNDALWTDAGYGVHIMVMRNMMGDLGLVRLDGVEIRRGGQRGKLGRYPFHWHMISYNGATNIGDATGHYIRNSVINQSMNRGIVIHGTNGTAVEDNVVYDVRGHGVFTEDASERGNTIDGNVVLHVRNQTPQDALKIHESGATAGRGSSGFWISNPDNTVTNNISGDCQTNGFWMAFPSQTFGLSAAVDIRPDRLAFGTFDNNIAFSNRLEGINLDWVEQNELGDIFPHGYISTSDGEEPQWPFPNLLTFTMNQCETWKNASHGFWDRARNPQTLEFVSADNCGRFFAGAGEGGLITRCLAIGNSLNHLMNATDRPNYTGEVTPAAFATYHSTFDIQENIAVNFLEVDSTMSGTFATNDYYIRPVEKGQVRNIDNLQINCHPGVKMFAENSYFNLAGALWDPNGNWGGTPGDYLVYDTPFFTYGQTADPVPPGPISGGVLVEGPFYGFNDFVVNQGNMRWKDLMAIEVNRLDNNFQSVGTWAATEAQNGWGFDHMRHFATNPSSYYQLNFPNNNDVIDACFTVSAMLDTSDYQVIAVQFDGTQIDQVYASTSFAYAGSDTLFDSNSVEDAPTSGIKHIYQAVNNLQEVIDSPLGETYWLDAQNNLVWLKIRGGMDQTYNPLDYAEHSDELLYWAFYFRIQGSSSLSPGSNQFSDSDKILISPNPTKGLIEIDGLASECSIQIIDINGAIVKSEPSTGSQMKVDMSELSTGIYTVRIYSKNTEVITTRKVVKQ